MIKYGYANKGRKWGKHLKKGLAPFFNHGKYIKILVMNYFDQRVINVYNVICIMGVNEMRTHSERLP